MNRLRRTLDSLTTWASLACGLCLLGSANATTSPLGNLGLVGSIPFGVESSALVLLAESAQDTAATAQASDSPVAKESLSAQGPGRNTGAKAGQNETLVLRSIPEPQTWLIAFCGLATLVALQRFRKRRGRTP